MGSVYLAQDLTLDKPVAIKTLLHRLAHDRRLVQLLKKQVRIAQKLRHENICATYDFHEGSHPSLVMEFVDGNTLSNFTFKQPDHRCSEDTVRRLADQMLAGLEYAHRQGVIHRDLKSDN